MKTKASLFKSMIISGIWACLLILIALVFDEGETAVVVLGLKIASFTYGGLLSLFILSRSKQSFTTSSLIFGLLVSLVSVFIMQEIDVAWTWFVGISVLLNLIIVYGLHFMGFKKGLGIFSAFIGIYIFSSMSFGYHNGLDVFAKDNFHGLKGKNVGMIYNHSYIFSF
jgi:hypothetical protein